MAQYGVGTANPFEMLDEDAPAKPVAKAPAAEKASAAPAATKAPEQSRTLDAPTKRGGAFPRGRGRGGRGGRGRGNGGFGNRPPRRMFERHSGTGRGKEVRKGGYGGYDAEGTMQDDMKAEEVAKQLTLEDAKPAAVGDAAVAAPQVPAPAPVPETEEEKKEREEFEKEQAREAAMLTYDQYMEQKKKKVVEDDLKIQTRQVEVDDKKFKACKVFAKSADEDYADILGSTDEAAADKKKGEKKAKKTKHLDEVLAELPAGNAPHSRPAGEYRGGFRGGRGGYGRGGAPRGGPRGGFGRGGRGAHVAPMAPVDVKSDTDFPKLGK